MRRLFIFAVMALALGFVPFAVDAAAFSNGNRSDEQPPAVVSQPPEDSQPKPQPPLLSDETEKLLAKLLEVHQKRLTLQFLADPRSREFVKALLADLPVETRMNLRSNITGARKKIFLDNFNAKWAEMAGDVLLALQKSLVDTDRALAIFDETPFPMNLAFAGVVKQLSQNLNFRLLQNRQDGDSAENGTLETQKSRIEALFTRLSADGSRDPYDAVKAIYAPLAHRDFPIWWFDDQAGEVAYITHGSVVASATASVKRKAWTVLVFLNADNNLEASGLKDLKEMEKVGSNDRLNVVVQIDRMAKGEGNAIAQGNWVGARRYEVVRSHGKEIASKCVANLGERDMGSKKELAGFLTWGIETYPADRYLLVVWNHGAGWRGISSDETSGNTLTMTDLTWALQQAKPSLAKINPQHPKFDIIDFDACLMGMIEVAWQLRDLADVLLASEESEPGNGMPYDDYLGPLAAAPRTSTRTLAKQMVAAYIKSYALDGSQTNKVISGKPVTKAAYDLSRLEPLVKAVDALGKALLARHDVYAGLLVDAFVPFAKIRRYADDSFVDLLDLARKLQSIKTLPEEARVPCADIIRLLGYPLDRDRLAEPIVIKRKEPGFVVWGFNGWKIPPKELWPARTEPYRTRFVRTPLKGPDTNGDYACAIGPFTVVRNPMKRRLEYVTELNYCLETAKGGKGPELTEKTGRTYTYVASFPAESPLIVEGHTQGMGNSHGISIYYPYAPEARTSYRTLAFAKDTVWADFVTKIPRYQRMNSVLLSGPMVEGNATLAAFSDATEKLKVPVDILWDPKVFGWRFKDIFRQYQDGVVILDGLGADAKQAAPTAEDVIGYLNGGGSLFLAAANVEQTNVNLPLFEEFFKFHYLDDDHDLPALQFADTAASNLRLVLNGPDSAQNAKDITIMECTSPAKPWLVTEDRRAGAIAVAGTSTDGAAYRGVYLGFRFEAIDTPAVRAQVLYHALEQLKPGLAKPPAAPAVESLPAKE